MKKFRFLFFLLIFCLPSLSQAGILNKCMVLMGKDEVVKLDTDSNYDGLIGKVTRRGAVTLSEALSLPLFAIEDVSEKQKYLNWVESAAAGKKFGWSAPKVQDENDLTRAVWKAIDIVGEKELNGLRSGTLIKALAERVQWKSLVVALNENPIQEIARSAWGPTSDNLNWITDKFVFGLWRGDFWLRLDPDPILIERGKSKDINGIIRILQRRYSLTLRGQSWHQISTRSVLIAITAAAILFGPELAQTAWMQYHIDSPPDVSPLVVKKDKKVQSELQEAIKNIDQSKLSSSELSVLSAIREN